MSETTAPAWRTMGAGPELDAVVAERVLGWTRGRREFGDMPWRRPGDGPSRGVLGVPPLSTDIAAAWKVVEVMRERGYFPHIGFFGQNESWRANFRRENADGEWADAAPLAICRAALAALASEP